MNRGKLVDVNGKVEKPVGGRVKAQKGPNDSDEDFLKKTVQFYNCQPKVVYEVIGKCNTVQIMDSKDCTLEVDTVVSGVEVTNCKNVTVRVKDGQELWTTTVNKTSGLTIILNDVVVKGGAEFAASGDESFRKEFQVIGAAISNCKVNRGGKVLSLPSKFEFKLDMSGPSISHTPFQGKLTLAKKGVEMAPEGAGLSIGDKAKGQTVYASGAIGKGKDFPMSVTAATNAVALDDCRRVALEVTDVKKEVQVVNSRQIKVKASGSLPKVVLTNTHGCYVTLDNAPADFTIVAEHFSDVNVNFPYGANHEKKEIALKEQFVYKFENDVVTYEEPTF